MPAQVDELQDRLERMDAVLHALEGRVRDLEAQLARSAVQVPAPPAGEPPAAPVEPPTEEAVSATPPSTDAGTESWAGTAGAWVGLVGRTLVTLGGAYLLRALTEGGVLGPHVGASAGLAYAALLLVLADREAAGGGRVGAGFQGVTAVLVAFPLVAEAAGRFGSIGPGVAAMVLVAALLATLGVAGRRGLTVVAWAACLAAVGTALGLMVVTRQLAVFTTALLAMVVAVDPFALRRWDGLRWVAAAGADLGVLLTVWIAGRGLPEGYPPLAGGTAALLALLLVVLSLAATARRALTRAGTVTGLDDVQAAAALAIGLGGAVNLLPAAGGSGLALGALALALGLGAYAAAFARLEKEALRAFYHYSTLGAVLLIVGSALLLGPRAGAVLWAGMALGSAWLGRRYVRRTLASHAVLYGLAAAVSSGLLGAARAGLLGASAGPWAEVTAGGLVALLAVGGAWWVLDQGRLARVDHWPGPLPLAAAGLLAGFSLAGLSSWALAALLAGAPGPTADAGLTAAARTVVLAALAVVVGRLGRCRPELRALGWVVLAAGGLKLLAEDLPQGRPASLFVAFAVYGGALIVASRRLRAAR